jgi:hypothetical protein
MNLCTCGHDKSWHGKSSRGEMACWGDKDGIERLFCPCQAFTSSGEDKTCIECSGKGEIILNQSHVGKPNKLVTCQRCNSTGVEPAAGDTEKDFGNPPVASESNQCVCGHDEADHKVMADRACWYEGVNGWGCGCPKFQPSHSERETVEQDIDPHADCDDTCHHKQLAKSVCLNCVALRKMGSPGKCFRHDGLVRCPYPDCKAS